MYTEVVHSFTEGPSRPRPRMPLPPEHPLSPFASVMAAASDGKTDDEDRRGDSAPPPPLSLGGQRGEQAQGTSGGQGPGDPASKPVERRDVFFFPFGAVVLWGFPGEEEERALIDRLAAAGQGDGEDDGGDGVGAYGGYGDSAGSGDGGDGDDGDDGDADSIYPEIDFLYDKAVAE